MRTKLLAIAAAAVIGATTLASTKPAQAAAIPAVVWVTAVVVGSVILGVPQAIARSLQPTPVPLPPKKPRKRR